MEDKRLALTPWEYSRMVKWYKNKKGKEGNMINIFKYFLSEVREEVPTDQITIKEITFDNDDRKYYVDYELHDIVRRVDPTNLRGYSERIGPDDSIQVRCSSWFGAYTIDDKTYYEGKMKDFNLKFSDINWGVNLPKGYNDDDLPSFILEQVIKKDRQKRGERNKNHYELSYWGNGPHFKGETTIDVEIRKENNE